MRRTRLLHAAAAVLLGAALFSLVPERAAAATPTRIIVPARTEVVSGEYGEVLATLQTASGATIADEHIVMTFLDEVRQRRTDTTGSTYFRIKNDLAPGNYTMSFRFPGTNIYTASQVEAILVVTRPTVNVQTVPILEGVPFVLGDERALTDVAGMARIPFTPPQPDERPTPGDLELNDRVTARFARWYGSSASRITATYALFYRIQFSFSDLAGHPVDRSLITGVTIKNSIGERFEFTDEQQTWFQGSRVVPLSGGLESKEIYYTVESVTVNGSNVVNRSQQKFLPSELLDWDIRLLFYSAQVSVHDALLRFPTGTAILLVYADGHAVNLPLNDGRLDLPSLPRGNYRISVVGPGLGISQPLALSRDQEVTLEFISYLDMTLVALAGLGIAFGLLQIGRPHLVPGAISGVGRAAGRLVPGRIWSPKTSSARTLGLADAELAGPDLAFRIGAASPELPDERRAAAVRAVAVPALAAPVWRTTPGGMPSLATAVRAALEGHSGADHPRRIALNPGAFGPPRAPVTDATPSNQEKEKEPASRRTEVAATAATPAPVAIAATPAAAPTAAKPAAKSSTSGAPTRTTAKPKGARGAKVAKGAEVAKGAKGAKKGAAAVPKSRHTRPTKASEQTSVVRPRAAAGKAGTAKAHGRAPASRNAVTKGKKPARTSRARTTPKTSGQPRSHPSAVIPLAIRIGNDEAGAAVRQLRLDSLGLGDPGDDLIEDRAMSRSAAEGDGAGTEVEICRGCGLSVWVGARFCRRCGEVLGEAARAGSPMLAAMEPSVQHPPRAVGGRQRRHADGRTADGSPKGTKGSRPTPGTA